MCFSQEGQHSALASPCPWGSARLWGNRLRHRGGYKAKRILVVSSTLRMHLSCIHLPALVILTFRNYCYREVCVDLVTQCSHLQGRSSAHSVCASTSAIGWMSPQCSMIWLCRKKMSSDIDCFLDSAGKWKKAGHTRMLYDYFCVRRGTSKNLWREDLK